MYDAIQEGFRVALEIRREQGELLSMKVKIKFYADLKNRYASHTEDGMIEVQMKEESTINDVLKRLHIDDREIGFVILNGEKAQKDAPLSEGAHIQIFSLVAGG